MCGMGCFFPTSKITKKKFLEAARMDGSYNLGDEVLLKCFNRFLLAPFHQHALLSIVSCLERSILSLNFLTASEAAPLTAMIAFVAQP